MTTPKRPRTIKRERQRSQRSTARERQDAEARRRRYARADYPTRDDGEMPRWRP